MQGRILIAGVVCLGLLAACGGSEQAAKPATPPAAEARVEAPAPKKPAESVVTIAALPDTEAVVMDTRIEGGKLPAGGRDSGKPAALRAAGFTIEAVVAPEESQSAEWAAIATSELNDAGFAVQQYDGRNNQYYIGIAGKPGALVSTPVAVAPVFSYLVFSMSDGKVRTYVNGELKATDAAPAGFEIRNSTATVHIGNSRVVARPFTGSIHEVRISDRAMPAAEVGEKWAALSKSAAAKKGP